MCGITDNYLRKEPLRVKFLNLEKTIALCGAGEAVITHLLSETNSVSAVKEETGRVMTKKRRSTEVKR